MKKIFLGVILLLIITFISFLFFFFISSSNIQVDKTIEVKKGDNISILYNNFSKKDQILFKIYLKKNGIDNVVIKPGSYEFIGTYSYKQLIDILEKGPEINYITIKLLEGWGIYDIDNYLYKEGYIKEGDYISKVTDSSFILDLTNKFNFLNDFLLVQPELNSLEGFLYPDSYYIEEDIDILNQLINLQLENFQKKVWNELQFSLLDFSDLNIYEILILASIIENEEKVNENKNLIAGIFLNRIDANSLIGADVTLCYGLKILYSDCYNQMTKANLTDKSNPYNTRAVLGLPPTPISSPSQSSVLSVISYEETDYFYYLHDKTGKIYPSKTLQDHNIKKSKYLNE